MTQAKPVSDQKSLWIWPFELKEQIGEGGMGLVYRARYVVNDRELAVKMVPADVTDKTALARFEREMAVLKNLKHPNIVRCFGGVCEDKQRFYAMELVPGGSLEDLLQQRKKFSWEQVVEYGLQMCAALECSHRHGVIHRDVKPGNFLIASNGRLKLSDFGLASVAASRRITQSGKTAGTFLYMAPEQIRGKELSPQTDLYALGCVLFELLSGRPPFVAETPAATLHMHCKTPPPKLGELVLDCPPQLEQLIAQLLAKDPAERPDSAAAVAKALRDVDQVVTVVPGQKEMGATTSVRSRPVTLPDESAELAADSGYATQSPVIRPWTWIPYVLIGTVLIAAMTATGLLRQARVSEDWEDQTLQMLRNRNPQVQRAALQSLGEIGAQSPRGLEAVAERLEHDEHENPEVRLAAVQALVEAGGGARKYLPALIQAEQQDPDPRVRTAVQSAIEEISDAPGSSGGWMLQASLVLLAIAAAGAWYWWSGPRVTGALRGRTPD
jgi:serine/threonine-protein kinase